MKLIDGFWFHASEVDAEFHQPFGTTRAAIETGQFRGEIVRNEAYLEARELIKIRAGFAEARARADRAAMAGTLVFDHMPAAEAAARRDFFIRYGSFDCSPAEIAAHAAALARRVGG